MLTSPDRSDSLSEFSKLTAFLIKIATESSNMIFVKSSRFAELVFRAAKFGQKTHMVVIYQYGYKIMIIIMIFIVMEIIINNKS